MNINRLLKARNGEYSFLWSRHLKYLWKLTTTYMKASFNLISKKQVLSQNISSLKSVYPSFLRNLQSRAWVYCPRHHWRRFLFEQSAANVREDVTHHRSVLPWTHHPGLKLDRAISTGLKNQNWNLLSWVPWHKPVTTDVAEAISRVRAGEFKFAIWIGVIVQVSFHKVMLKCSLDQSEHVCWFCITVGWNSRSPSLPSLYSQVLEH